MRRLHDRYAGDEASEPRGLARFELLRMDDGDPLLERDADHLEGAVEDTKYAAFEKCPNESDVGMEMLAERAVICQHDHAATARAQLVGHEHRVFLRTAHLQILRDNEDRRHVRL